MKLIKLPKSIDKATSNQEKGTQLLLKLVFKRILTIKQIELQINSL